KELYQIPAGANELKLSKNLNFGAYYQAVKVRETVKEKHKDLEKAEAKIYDDLMYRHWDTFQDENANQLFVINLNQKDTKTNSKNLLEGTLFECPHAPFGGSEDYVFSPDEKYLVYVSKKLTGK